MHTLSIERHLTAIGRASLSRPLRLALENGVLTEGDSVMDYGCGRGDDTDRLAQAGFAVAAWDPHFRPQGERRVCDVVNLGYLYSGAGPPPDTPPVRSSFKISRCSASSSLRKSRCPRQRGTPGLRWL